MTTGDGGNSRFAIAPNRGVWKIGEAQLAPFTVMFVGTAPFAGWIDTNVSGVPPSLRRRRHILQEDLSTPYRSPKVEVRGGRRLSSLRRHLAQARRSRSGRLTEIESLCAHVNSNRDLMILSRNNAGHERARHCRPAYSLRFAV